MRVSSLLRDRSTRVEEVSNHHVSPTEKKTSYWPFYTSCLRDRVIYTSTAQYCLHSRAEIPLWCHDMFWLTSSAIRGITSLYFTCVQIRFSVGLILLVWSFIHMYDALPRAAPSSDMNESQWQIQGTCSYRCYIAMTSSAFATRLMKTEWWAAADRISQCK